MARKARKLTHMQRLFVAEYLVDLNATQAAIRAGYSARTANEQAARLLANVSIQESLETAMKKRERKIEITAEKVLEQYARFAFADVRQLFQEDGRLKPMSEWPDDAAAAVAGIETMELDGEVPGLVRKLKLVDKRASLADIGKHLGMFKEQIEVNGKIDLATVLSEARKRVATDES
ncbi:MAG: terminase small subunit [Desulfovibrio sp.]|jgi:phage terminase small subunit|nr:terminase small subunit [Desulfovibrio sp.]